LIFCTKNSIIELEIKESGMSFKPLSRKIFEKFIKAAGWKLEKGAVDWNLYNGTGGFVCSVIISHGKRTKSEVTAHSVHKTKKAFEERGLIWPPKQK
jgi:hypothetical protein